MKWFRYTVTGVEHLADCIHMEGRLTTGREWPNSIDAIPVTNLENPCDTCLWIEERGTVGGRAYSDGLTAQERFLAGRNGVRKSEMAKEPPAE